MLEQAYAESCHMNHSNHLTSAWWGQTKSRDALIGANLPGLDSVTTAEVGAEEEEQLWHGQWHRDHLQHEPRDWCSPA